MLRILLATFVSAAVAVAVATIAALVGWRGIDTPLNIAVHVLVFGTIIVFPIAFLGGVPLYYLFRWRGWLTPSAVLIGGTTLALVYPLVAWWENKPGEVSFGYFFVCGAAGAAASVVFIRLSKTARVQGQL
jgi:hypothetical protein